MCLVPLNALIECHSRATEDIQSAPNGQVNLSFAASVHFLQVLQMTSATSVGDGYRAPIGQFGYELLVNALLQSLHVCRVNQELRAVWFQE